MSTSRVLRNASLLGVAQAVSMATGFVSTAWLARMLGPEAYGILGFGTALFPTSLLRSCLVPICTARGKLPRRRKRCRRCYRELWALV